MAGDAQEMHREKRPVEKYIGQDEMDLAQPGIHHAAKHFREPVINRREQGEAVHFAEKNPDKVKASLGKVLKISDMDTLQSAYDTYAVSLVNRSMIVPASALAEAVEVARDTGTNVRKKPAELFDNSFAEQLAKSGFLKELWGAELR
jgi:uncharacterized protein (DUF488 family)